MNAPNELKPPAVPADTSAANFREQWTSYCLDAMQRSLLFLDVLRERRNNMLEHEDKRLLPLLDFDHETLLDARTFERPANYALLRILGAHGERMLPQTQGRGDRGALQGAVRLMPAVPNPGLNRSFTGLHQDPYRKETDHGDL